MASSAHNSVENQPLSVTAETQQIDKDDNETITSHNSVENQPLSVTAEMQQIDKDDNEMITSHNSVESQQLTVTAETQQIDKDDNETITSNYLLAEMKSMEVRMKLHMDELFERFTKQLTSTENTIAFRIESELDTINDIGGIVYNRLDDMDRDIFKRDELKAQISNLKGTLADLKRRQRQKKDSMQRLAKEATIVGIDTGESHDLKSIFEKACEYIEFTPPELKEICKLEPIPSEGNTKQVSAKFLTVNDRNRTIEAFGNFQKKNKGPIKMRDVGIASDSTFRIYESLTKEKRNILQYALSRKRRTHIHEAFAYKGAVYVRLQNGNPSIQVTSKKHLKNLLNH